MIGERGDLAPDIAGLLAEAEDLTRANTGLRLIIAFNYGSRDEIVRATRILAERVAPAANSPPTRSIATPSPMPCGPTGSPIPIC